MMPGDLVVARHRTRIYLFDVPNFHDVHGSLSDHIVCRASGKHSDVHLLVARVRACEQTIGSIAPPVSALILTNTGHLGWCYDTELERIE